MHITGARLFLIGTAVLGSIAFGWFTRRWQPSHRSLKWVLIVVTSVAFGFYAWYSIWLYTHFEAHASDLGIFDQALWNASRFHLPSSTVRGVSNLLGDHFHPVIFILVPLYWLSASPLNLLVTQALLFAALIPLTYLIARSWTLPVLPSITLSIAVGCNIGIMLALSFDFHEVAFSAPLFLSTILLASRKKWFWYWISVTLFLCTKETMGVYAAGIGIWLLTQRQWKRGLSTIIIGIAAFSIITRVVIPALADDHRYYYDQPFSRISSTTLGIPLAIMKHPIHAAQELVNDPAKRNTMKWTIGSFLGLPLLGLPFLPLLLLTFAERFWADNVGLWYVQFHYQVMMAVVFTVATLWVLSRAQHRLFRYGWIVTAVSGLVLGATITINFRIQSLQRLFDQDIITRPIQRWRTALSYIPKNASVAAQDGFVPHLTNRQFIYTFPKHITAQYIILDPRAPRFPMSADDVVQYQQLLRSDSSWETVFDQSGTTVFRHK